MTSSTLVLETSTVATAPTALQEKAIATKGSEKATSPQASSSHQRLPYSKTQQIELLHLQAEAEALLQQVQVLTQQKRLPVNV